MGINDGKAFLALPPRGLSESRGQIGPDKYVSYTLMCDASLDCYATAYGKSEESVRFQLNNHVCPAPARLDDHSTNKTAVQNMWEELDNTIDAIKAEGADYEEGPFAALKGKAEGLAFGLALLCRPFYRTREDVLRQANRRWKMRNGELPYEITPGYNYYPSQPLAYAKREAEEQKPVVRKAAKPTLKAINKLPTAPAPRAFTVAERDSIIDLVTGGVATVENVAKMYNVTPERIQTMLPKDNAPTTLEGFMFG